MLSEGRSWFREEVCRRRLVEESRGGRGEDSMLVCEVGGISEVALDTPISQQKWIKELQVEVDGERRAGRYDLPEKRDGALRSNRWSRNRP